MADNLNDFRKASLVGKIPYIADENWVIIQYLCKQHNALSVNNNIEHKIEFISEQLNI